MRCMRWCTRGSRSPRPRRTGCWGGRGRSGCASTTTGMSGISGIWRRSNATSRTIRSLRGWCRSPGSGGGAALGGAARRSGQTESVQEEGGVAGRLEAGDPRGPDAGMGGVAGRLEAGDPRGPDAGMGGVAGRLEAGDPREAGRGDGRGCWPDGSRRFQGGRTRGWAELLAGWKPAIPGRPDAGLDGVAGRLEAGDPREAGRGEGRSCRPAGRRRCQGGRWDAAGGRGRTWGAVMGAVACRSVGGEVELAHFETER